LDKVKISELQARIESESGFSQRNSDILKEIAEMICKLVRLYYIYSNLLDYYFYEILQGILKSLKK